MRNQAGKANFGFVTAAAAAFMLLGGTVYGAAVPFTVDADTALLYHLDEAVGSTTAVDAANGIDLTAGSSPFTGATGPGSLGGAATFAESGDYQLTRTATAADISKLSTTSLTIEAWVRNPDQTSGPSNDDHDAIFDYRNGGANRIEFTILGADAGASAGRLRLTYHRDDTAGYYSGAVSGDLTWEQDVWYHVAATYDSNTAAANDSIVRIFRATESDPELRLVAQLMNQPDIEPLTVGGSMHLGGVDNFAPRSFGGDIAEFRYSNTVRYVPEPAAALGLAAGLILLGRRTRHAARI